MANITLGKALSGQQLAEMYETESLELVSKSATKTVFKDAAGLKIVFTGKGFKFKGDDTTAGTVTGVQFLNDAGENLIKIAGVRFDEQKTSDAYAKDKIFGLISLLTSGKDRIVGSSANDDMIVGLNSGDDSLFGKGGDDFIKGSAGNNRLDGGAGEWDVLSYQETFYDKSNAKKGTVIDVGKGIVKNSWGGTDTIANFEEFRGSYLGDTIKGGKNNDTLMGLAGKDTLDGGGGRDEVRYHEDADYGGKRGIVADLTKNTIKDGFGAIDSVKNIERVSGTYVNDVFKGNAQDNFFRGVSGKDRYDGGAGSDTVSLYWWEDEKGQHGVKVDLRLSTGQIIDDGFGVKETTRSIENIEGSKFDDDITLGAVDGYIWADDGNDRLVAGAGENWLGGGDGVDTFTFLAVSDSPAGTSERDFIDDFSQADGDRLDLSAFAGLNFVGDTGLTGGSPQIAYRYNTDGNTVVSVDVGGDGNADLEFLLKGKIALNETDFVIV